MFESVNRPESSVAACARVMREAILAGDLVVGERLPPERTLALQLGVNRVTVRSALAELKLEGLLSVRQGSGYRVEDYRAQAGPGLVAALLARGSDPVGIAADLLLVRRALAQAVLTRLAERSERDCVEVRDALGRFEAVVSDAEASRAQVARADLDVLRALVRLSGSTVLELFLNPVVEVLRDFDVLAEAVYADPPAQVGAYRVLLSALEGEGPLAVEAALTLLEARDQATLARVKAQRGGGDDVG